MPALSNGSLRIALALKLGQIKLATRSYLRDRAGQATGTVTAYAIAARLFAAAGVFLTVRHTPDNGSGEMVISKDRVHR